MKKLALIVLLAVVASRVLSEHDDRPGPNVVQPFSIVNSLFDDDATPPQPPPLPALKSFAPLHPPEPPQAIRSIPWRGESQESTDSPAPSRRTSRSRRAPVRQPAPSPAPVPSSNSKAAPAWFPTSELDEETLARPDDSGSRILLGRLSVSEDRARADLRKIVQREIADWLAADVPMDWTPPQKLVDRMVLGSYVQTVLKNFGPTPGETPTTVDSSDASKTPAPELDELYTLFRAGQKLDFSANRRHEFVKRYQRDVASARMKRSGGVVAVVLAGLALISFYVRADEATKGYYTNRLRVLALAGLGVAGAVAYRYMV